MLPLNNSTPDLMRVWKFCVAPLTMSGESVSNATSLFPRQLVIQSDKTVAQAKNQHVAMFPALLVSRGLFLSVNLMFLVVGHTHEDIDMFFRRGRLPYLATWRV
jgi:hypothetical protein